MMRQFRVCVFCGASDGNSIEYTRAAQELAKQISLKSWHLVYGGGTRGIMGTLATSVVHLAGPLAVRGIVPQALIDDGNGGHLIPPEAQYGQTTLVSSMHERKLLMAKMADAFIALPGGFGTLEELFEIITWNQLGIHDRPIVIFNVNGFYDLLLDFIASAIERGFIPAAQSNIIVSATTAAEVVECILAYRPSSGRYLLKWSKI